MQNVREILEGPKMQIIEQLTQDLIDAHRMINQLLNIVYLEHYGAEENHER